MKRLRECLQLYFFFMIASIALFSGCSDDASTVGSALFPNNVHVDSLFLYADSSATYRTAIAGNSENLVVGLYQNTVGLYQDTTEARLLLQFSIPFGIADTNILSAEVKLIRRYWFKDPSGILAFNIHKIKRAWSEFAVTFDSTNNAFYEPEMYGTFSQSVSPDDTLIVAQLNTALVRNWVRTRESNNGIILVPTEASTVIYGFTSSPFLPELFLRHVVPDSTRRIDTTIVPILQDAFVAYAPPHDSSPQLIYVQAGVADRGILHFDVRAIPDAASIVSAKLTFVRNSALSVQNELSIHSIDVHPITDTTQGSLRLGVSDIAKPVAGGTSSEFTANINTIVQQWVIGRPNYGVALRAFGEFSTLDRFVFYGATADSLNHRPQLRIIYSIMH